MNENTAQKESGIGSAKRSDPDPLSEGWQRLADKGEPKEGQTLVAQGNSSARVLLTRTGGKVYATQTECGHMRFPLGEGKVEGSLITCPLHKAQFDLSTGAVVRMPRIPWILRATKVGRQMGSISCHPLLIYEVEERPDGVYVRRGDLRRSARSS